MWTLPDPYEDWPGEETLDALSRAVIAHRRTHRRPEENEYDLILEIGEKLGKLERALREDPEHGERRAGDAALQIATVALRLYEWYLDSA